MALVHQRNSVASDANVRPRRTVARLHIPFDRSRRSVEVVLASTIRGTDGQVFGVQVRMVQG